MIRRQAAAPIAGLLHPGVQLTLIAVTQILGLSVWFSSSAVAASLMRDWGISLSEVAWLSMATQIGFAIGAIVSAVSGILDRWQPKLVIGVSALTVAALTFVFSYLVSSLSSAVAVRLLQGVCFAGIYPPGLKLTSSWSLRKRSVSFGVLGGCLTIGSCLPYLVRTLGDFPWQTLVACTGVACAIAGMISLLFIRVGPHQLTRVVPEGRYCIRMFRETGPRAACLGYFGHMFELYAVWTWLPLFMMHSLASTSITPRIGFLVFLCLGIGGFIGCVGGGLLADRFGRERVACAALAISGFCCLISPLFFGAALPVLLVFASVWGAAVIADSGLFSAMLSTTAKAHAVGTALSFQTAVGFLITIGTIQLTPLAAEAFGWRYAFPYLVIGPILGIFAVKLNRSRDMQATAQ